MDGICWIRLMCLAALFCGIYSDGVERIGNYIVASPTTIQTNHTVFLLDDVVLKEGVVFAFSAYFRTSSRVVFQIWRPLSNDAKNSHKLVAYLEGKSSVISGREDMYVASRLNIPCTRVQTGDRLGVYFPESPSGISYVFDGLRATALGAQVDNIDEMFNVGQSRRFDLLPFPFVFSAAAYVDTNLTNYPQGEEFPECPDLLIPEHLRPVLPDLPIPTGVNGSTGAQGPRGSQGNPGVVGLQGERGILVGYTGAIGPDGHTGPQGNIGGEGEVGPLGPTGQQGAEGMQGVKGESGEIGLPGPQGPTGAYIYSTPYLPYAELKVLTSSTAHIGLLVWLFVLTAASILLLVIVIVVCRRRLKEWEEDDEVQTIVGPKKHSSAKKMTTLEYTPQDVPTIIYEEIEAPSTLPRSKSKENLYSNGTLKSINSLRSDANSTISHNSEPLPSKKKSPFMVTSSAKNSPMASPRLGSVRHNLDVDPEDTNGSWASAINEIYATKLKTDDVISFKEKKAKREHKDGSNVGDVSYSTDTLGSNSTFVEEPTYQELPLTNDEIHMY